MVGAAIEIRCCSRVSDLPHVVYKIGPSVFENTKQEFASGNSGLLLFRIALWQRTAAANEERHRRRQPNGRHLEDQMPAEGA